jgi:hypothetical protein
MTVGQSVLVSGSHLEPMTRFFFLFDSCRFHVGGGGGCPLWWEDGSVIYSYNCFWALPEQSLWVPSPAELRQYFTVSFETHPTWSAKFPYLYYPGTGWASCTPRHWVPFHHLLWFLGLWASSSSYIVTDGQSASLSWCWAPIWGLWPDFYYCQTFAVFMLWGALPVKRTGL